MSKKWEKFDIVCNNCGRHQDEGITLSADHGGMVIIECPCGQEEEK